MTDLSPGAIESVTTGLINLLTPEMQNNVTAAFKVITGYPHTASTTPYSAYVNIIDMSSEEFGQGQRYKTNLIQNRKLLTRISVWIPRAKDGTLYKDGTVGSSGSTEQLYLDRICDRIQRCLITNRNLNMNRVCDTQLRGISPLLFDESLNAFSKTMSFQIEYEEII